jgi:thiol-disulfide isomerase/thioredoxin
MADLARRLTAALALVSALAWPGAASPQDPEKISRVEFQTIDGDRLGPDQLRGRVVLLDFWATWCAPCLAELPRLKKLYASYSRDQLAIIGISLDTLERRTFRSWLSRNGIHWPQVQDGRGYNGTLARTFDVQQLPVTVLLDRDGRVAHRDLRGTRLEAAIRELVPRDTPR